MYFVYFLISVKNNKKYVGSTSKIPIKRLEEHNIGTNKWTRQNGPFVLVYYERYFCLKDAQEREKFYKKNGRGWAIFDFYKKYTSLKERPWIEYYMVKERSQ